SMAFNIWYYLFIEQPDKFSIVVKDSKGKLINKTVKALSLQQLNKQAPKNHVNKSVMDFSERMKGWREEPLHLELVPEQSAAIMTVQSFSVDMDRFRQRVDSFFKVIATNKTEKLIINLADNGGGEVELAADLLNYFIKDSTSIVEYSYILTDRDEDLN